MFRKPPRLAIALAATAAACCLAATTADAALHRRILRVRMTGAVLVPAHVKAGYVGAAGYPYGPPGPIRPMLVDIPSSGFFTPTGVIGYGQAVVVGTVGGVPTLVPNVVGLGTGFATDVVGAGTSVVGGGAGYILSPLR